MTKEELQAIKKRWHEEVYDRSDRIDKFDKYIWEGVLVGFLIGAGVTPAKAKHIAVGAPENGWEV